MAEPVAHRLGSGALAQCRRRGGRPERMRTQPLHLPGEPRAGRVVADHVAVDRGRIEGAVEPAAAPVVGHRAEQGRRFVLAMTGLRQVIRDTLPRLRVDGDDAYPSAIAGDGTPRRGFVDAAKAYGERYREAVRDGFRNRLGAGTSNLKFDFQQ